MGKFYCIIDKVEQDSREFDPVARDGHFVGGRGRQAQHFVLDTTSVSILGYEHDLTIESVILLWNAVSNDFST